MKLKSNLWQFLVLGLAVTLVLSIYADFGALVRALGTFDWRVLPLVLGLTLGNQFFRFVKWEYLLRRVDVSLPVGTSFHVFGSGLIMIMTPGKLGEVWKSWLVRDVNGTPVSRTLPVVATERITDLLGVVAISVAGVVAFDRSPVLLVALAAPLLGGILFLQHERGCRKVLDVLSVLPVVGQRADGLRELYENSRDLLRLRPLGITTALSIFSWGLECVGLWLVLLGFDAEVPLLVAAFVFGVSSILGAVSLLPGGLGVTDGSITGLLLVFGVDKVVAASTTLVIRAATLWFVAGLSLLVYASFRRRESVDIRASDTEPDS